MDPATIRNFCIIAHIDHGKSTLADRFLELAGAVSEREASDQMLDDMDLEKERGITIKAKAVTLHHTHEGTDYTLNLIDTPGHVDFSYEVSRSLASCEGALLLVDASQGIEAQTVANMYLAMEAELEIIAVLNKVDMVAARPEEVADEIHSTFGMEPDEIYKVSAKSGLGVDALFKAVIEQIPPPAGDSDAPLRAMIFDSNYDEFRGVTAYVRVVDGAIEKGRKVMFMGTGFSYEVLELGIFGPEKQPRKRLGVGEVGYLICGIKEMTDVKVGDTVTDAKHSATESLPGFKEPQCMVYCGLYPSNNADFPDLRKALDKLKLNDASFTYQAETSDALGFGFRCGFLGLLHMEIVQERLERESSVNVIQTAPNVTYLVETTDGEEVRVERPAALPDPNHITAFKEPIVALSQIIPTSAVGAIMQLNTDRRGIYKKTEYLSAQRVILHYELPLSEIIYDYYDQFKSATRGFGTMDYEIIDYREANLVKMDILVNSVRVDALSTIVHRDNAEHIGRKLIVKLKRSIPRHMFKIPIQAALGGRIVARETISALRKNVTAKCYGGDITRKRKLLEKQKAGKKRMKAVGNVQIPQKAFMAVLSTRADK